MDWLEVTVFAVILFMDCVWIDGIVVVLFPYSPAPITTRQWVVLIS
jgi:hypothetical protein